MAIDSSPCPGQKASISDRYNQNEPLSRDLTDQAYTRLVCQRIRKLEHTVNLAASDRQQRRGQESLISNQFEKVNRGADFLPVDFLYQGAECARAVCRIKVPGSLGSGFLIASRRYIMTNNHVLSSVQQADDSIAQFFFEHGREPISVNLLPQQFFITNKALDYTIVACDPSPLPEITPFVLHMDPARISRHEAVNIIQHPKGRRKEIAIHNNQVIRVQDKVLHYRTDTEPGSSGSPVTNNDWQLVALHHAGWKEDETRAINEGIKIPTIVADLYQQLSRHESVNPHLQTLLRDSYGTNRDLGFFGPAGIVSDSWREVEVPGFQGSVDFADIGFWNIEHFNHQVSTHRLSMVADVVEQLNMDVMGLVEVEDSAMQSLVLELQQRGLDQQYHLLDVRGSQDLAVLFDRETTQVELRADLNDRYRDKLDNRVRGKTAFPRDPLFTKCSVSEGNQTPISFILIVVHLKAYGDSTSRARRQRASEILTEIIADIRETEDLPVILGGDMNEKLNNDVLSALRDNPDLFALTADDAHTDAVSYIGGRKRSLIDHVITTRDIKIGDIAGDDAAIVRLDKSMRDFTDEVSDHLPVVMRMIYRDQEEPTTPPAEEDEIPIPDGATKVRLKFS